MIREETRIERVTRLALRYADQRDECQRRLDAIVKFCDALPPELREAARKLIRDGAEIRATEPTP